VISPVAAVRAWLRARKDSKAEVEVEGSFEDILPLFTRAVEVRRWVRQRAARPAARARARRKTASARRTPAMPVRIHRRAA